MLGALLIGLSVLIRREHVSPRGGVIICTIPYRLTKRLFRVLQCITCDPGSHPIVATDRSGR